MIFLNHKNIISITVFVTKQFIMKRILFVLFAFLTMTTSAQNIEQDKFIPDTLSQELKEIMYSYTEELIVKKVDSIANEGMYMQALEVMDSLQVIWKNITGKEPSPRMYISKGQIYSRMEERQSVVDATIECVNNNKDTMQGRVAALVFSMQGSGYRNLEEYHKAIRSYERALGYYSEIGDLGSQGDMLCSIAYSYNKQGKTFATSSFYEKGLSRFLEYFNVTKKQLLKSNLKVVDDTYKEAVLNMFGTHLYAMAVFEQDIDDKVASKEYLLMSAHCGNSMAISEYKRIYGNY